MSNPMISSHHIPTVPVAFCVLLVCACGPAAPVPVESEGTATGGVPVDSSASQAPGHTPDPTGAVASVYVCDDDVRFSVRLRGDSAYLALPERSVTLGRSAVSADVYEGGGYTYTIEGGEARLVTAEGALDCRGQAAGTPWEEAALLGIEFRAVGNEPGWKVEINQGEWLRYIGDYGATHTFAPMSEVTVDDDGTGASVYRAHVDGRNVAVAIREAACSDTMSGETFTHTVSVRADDAPELHGCGRTVEAVE